MAIDVIIDGVTRTVTKQEVFDLAAQGLINPQTPINVNGTLTTARKVKGIVFGQSQVDPADSSNNSDDVLDRLFAPINEPSPVQPVTEETYDLVLPAETTPSSSVPLSSVENKPFVSYTGTSTTDNKKSKQGGILQEFWRGLQGIDEDTPTTNEQESKQGGWWLSLIIGVLVLWWFQWLWYILGIIIAIAIIVAVIAAIIFTIGYVMNDATMKKGKMLLEKAKGQPQVIAGIVGVILLVCVIGGVWIATAERHRQELQELKNTMARTEREQRERDAERERREQVAEAERGRGVHVANVEQEQRREEQSKTKETKRKEYYSTLADWERKQRSMESTLTKRKGWNTSAPKIGERVSELRNVDDARVSKKTITTQNGSQTLETYEWVHGLSSWEKRIYVEVVDEIVVRVVETPMSEQDMKKFWVNLIGPKPLWDYHNDCIYYETP